MKKLLPWVALAAWFALVWGLMATVFRELNPLLWLPVFLLLLVFGAQLIGRIAASREEQPTSRLLGFAPPKPPEPEEKLKDQSKRRPDQTYDPAKERKKWRFAAEKLPRRKALAALPPGTRCKHCNKLFMPDSEGRCNNCQAPL